MILRSAAQKSACDSIMLRKLSLGTMLVPVLLTVKILCVNSFDFTESHVNLTIFYQSRCNDSALFFEEQLKPTFAELSSRGIGVNLELIPYGRANLSNIEGNYIISCEHGEEECEGNKFHACVANRTLGNDGLMLDITACMLDRFYMDSPREHVSYCCEMIGEPCKYEVLRMCASSSVGTQLLFNNGLLTAKWNPFFMPTILLNGDAGDDEFQKKLKTNLLGTVLKYLAEATASSTPLSPSPGMLTHTDGIRRMSAMPTVTREAHLYIWNKACASYANPIIFISLLYFWVPSF